jgi:hypothetical protein
MTLNIRSYEDSPDDGAIKACCSHNAATKGGNKDGAVINKPYYGARTEATFNPFDDLLRVVLGVSFSQGS